MKSHQGCFLRSGAAPDSDHWIAQRLIADLGLFHGINCFISLSLCVEAEPEMLGRAQGNGQGWSRAFRAAVLARSKQAKARAIVMAF
jgi:hypothetical protein